MTKFDDTPIRKARTSLEDFRYPAMHPLPILMLNMSERGPTRSNLARAISDVDSVTSCVIDVQEKLAEIACDLRLWKAKIVNSLAPINSLPHEILQLIFGFTMTNTARDLKRSMCLSHVCSRWRIASISASTLWSHIRISHQRDLGLLPTLLQRAINQPLMLECQSYTNTPWSLDLRDGVGGKLAQALVHLRVILGFKRSLFLPSSPLPMLSSYIEDFHPMALANPFVVSPAISLITHLELHNATVELAAQPVEFPNLASIVLARVRAVAIMTLLSSITAPNLATLSIHAYDLGWRIDACMLPNLRRLEFHDIHAWPRVIQALYPAFICQNVGEIVLKASGAFKGTPEYDVPLAITTLLRNSPNLQSLTLSMMPGWMSTHLQALIPSPEGGILAPKLNNLSIQALKLNLYDLELCKTINVLVRDIIKTRISSGMDFSGQRASPIMRLEISERYVFNHEAWFHERVPELVIERYEDIL
ncbi:hypothetical protein DL93DRAFT_1068063 [Clavulina sp. PMI_390]|nr:hypothetical protein DL93DRAFT_1068063 [Clavulina sp. PMI_390]